MDDFAEKPCKEIDACIFSGDIFINPEARKELREYMARWERGLKELDETFPNGVSE